ncbi:MAG: hypothetical protein A3J24_12620 [Deltaproteobacteria bacterium RIFCSPLOWO2_02_FULL_53_8]|nr:MAG: hypothetical protein A3J24_12620 [Deltaproteobacteria bacterium RIFCSPLOWO2_02_FULL_53_8]
MLRHHDAENNMAQLKIRFNLTPTQTIVAVVVIIVSLILYSHWVEVSVNRAGDQFRQALVDDCSRREFSALGITPDDLSRTNELVEALAACKTIKVSRITANGGLILAVMVRLELSDEGYLPNGKRVWYVSTERSKVFPFTIFNLISGVWPIDPIVGREGMEFFYYLRL